MSNSFVAPTHSHLPEIGHDSNLLFEFLAFVQSIVILGCQYLNLYRAVWWLPYSTVSYAINFQLIDVNLVIVLVIFMGRRFLYSVYQELPNKSSEHYFTYMLVRCLKFIITSSVLIAFLYAGYRVVRRNGFIYCSFLCYPLITYVILFQFNFKALFCKLPVQQVINCQSETPIHACSLSPDEIREETERLKSDFNTRMMQILFNSMLCAYYMACVPLRFAQSSLQYNIWWVVQYILLVWLGSTVLFANHYFPVKYLDVLHRCSVHLGNWTKIEARFAPHIWSELQLFPQDSTVKHVKGLFRAAGMVNAAEPGNVMHTRFYFMFQKPLRVTNGILCFTLLLILYEFITLLFSNQWNNMLTIAFLLFPNYFVLFNVLRNRFILEKVHKNI
ncbi:hypothetical protein HELRODRAFT_69178 [Helobdella robusta]|uniref:Transmembrane protein 39A n=1 Tax=Helobdella robusta TaxID=6412 RepID=T1FZQ6_HELRO|nr:hypothetical protein HELRODRAFT_69178 [Helobdella robusta]ESN94375.1 hypothetical protein HELRODRAFT_69178 [Helobdella robusta]